MAMTMTSTESHKNAYSLTLQINSHLDLQLKMPHILPLESLKIPHSKGEMLTLVMGCSLCPPLIFFKLPQKKKNPDFRFPWLFIPFPVIELLIESLVFSIHQIPQL